MSKKDAFFKATAGREGKFSKYAFIGLFGLRKSFYCGIMLIERERNAKKRRKIMEKMLTDMHTHTTFSHDGKDAPATMIEAAREKGIAFYGVSEHFDYDYDRTLMTEEERQSTLNGDEADYFHTVRHLQEDYEGVVNVAVGAEFGYSDDPAVQKRYAETYEKYRPDFVINSVHGDGGRDFARYSFEGKTKKEVYKAYLALVRRSLDAPYPYDVVGHIGYIARYVPFADKAFSLDEFGEELDGILKAIVEKGKILEVNSANKTLENRTLPALPIIKRYYELGGRKISFGSDAHFVQRIADKREEIAAALKKIGFTHFTVPFRGEYIKIEI